MEYSVVGKGMVFRELTPIKKGLYKTESISIENQAITTKHKIENMVTNGLGYDSISKDVEEHKDTPYGLIEHLGNMDKAVLTGELIEREIAIKSLMQELFETYSGSQEVVKEARKRLREYEVYVDDNEAFLRGLKKTLLGIESRVKEIPTKEDLTKVPKKYSKKTSEDNIIVTKGKGFFLKAIRMLGFG